MGLQEEWEEATPVNDSLQTEWEAAAPAVTVPVDDTPAWAAKYPNLYGLYGAGRAVARTGIEGLGTTLGAAGGAVVPIPGSTLVGGGLGYAGAKRVADVLLGDKSDNTMSGIGQDVAIGGLMQGAGSVASKIPFVRNLIAPKAAGIGAEASSIPLQNAGTSLMEKAMKIPPSVPSSIRNETISTMLEGGIPVSKRALTATKDVITNLNTQIDSAVANSPYQGNTILTRDVLGPVMELKQTLLNTVGGKRLGTQIDDLVKEFVETEGQTMTVARAQQLKQNTNKILNAKGAYGELEAATVEAKKQVVRGLKDQIAAKVPEISGLNMQYRELKMVEKALERAVNRTGNWDAIGLVSTVAGAGAGAATGTVAGAAKAAALMQVIKAPYLQSRLAIALYSAGAGKKANIMANTIVNSIYNNLSGGYE